MRKLGDAKGTSTRARTALRALALLGVLACTVGPARAQKFARDWTESGTASWYGPGFAGKPTASGEIYNPDHLTAAHKTLPLGSLVRVYNVENDREMIVRINDRGPFIHGRVIDLSRAAAEVLDFRDDGLARVELTLIRPAPTRKAGQALLEGVGRVTTAGLSRILQPKLASNRHTHASEAEVDSPASPHDPSETEADPTSWLREGLETAEGYFIQVGAFRESPNAWELMERIDNLGMASHLDQAGNVFRVLVGPFQQRSGAVDAQRDLDRVGIEGFLRTSGR